ncbi:MAG TPA: TetR/AcrR family transcriptional regulator [Candidatus Binataceae bacterium]|nr:TetR/AcrR family transcriptional regulator [Candidatus Binataceae bacterium]
MRERILESATVLFSEHEFDRVLIDQVAARARVGKGSVYRRFRSKEELYAAVVIAGIDELQKQIRAGLAQTSSSYEQITTFVRLAVAFFWNRRQFFALLHDPKALAPAQARAYREQRERLARMLSELLRDGVERGAIRADLDTRLAAESVLGMVRGLNRYGREFATPAVAVETIIAIFLDGCAQKTRADYAAVAGR